MTVLILGNHIAFAGRDRIALPTDAMVIDGTGKFLIPGLWDMHVHVQHDPEVVFPLFIANGVTGVRDMGGPINDLLRWRNQIAWGRRIGPRLVLAGPHLDGPKSPWPYARIIASATDARNAVVELKKDGADFVKVQSWLPREAYFAIANEAKAQGLPLAGHVPDSISAFEVVEAGQRSIEHMTGILLACSSREEGLRKLAADHAVGVAAEVDKQAIESYDETKALSLFELFAKGRVWQTPTFTIWQARASAEEPTLLSDPHLEYVPQSARRYWENRTSSQVLGLKHEYVVIAKQILRKHQELVPSMRKAGVQFLAGTDTPFPFCVPGFSLHQELILLVQSGMSPGEALQTATYNPALYLGLQDSLGTIENGKLADLVLLNGNPLETIESVSRIATVVVNGHYYSRKDLDSMLDHSRTAAAGK